MTIKITTKMVPAGNQRTPTTKQVLECDGMRMTEEDVAVAAAAVRRFRADEEVRHSLGIPPGSGARDDEDRDAQRMISGDVSRALGENNCKWSCAACGSEWLMTKTPPVEPMEEAMCPYCTSLDTVQGWICPACSGVGLVPGHPMSLPCAWCDGGLVR